MTARNTAKANISCPGLSGWASTRKVKPGR